MAARPDAFDVLKATDVPALVIWGDEDELSTRADVEAMVEALPQGELVVIEGAGHLTAVEAPETFTQAVHDFLT
jgi:pimeloyl-ACP methyl ester carboxylesterase